jgi:predicted outer membrane repeat protein
MPVIVSSCLKVLSGLTLLLASVAFATTTVTNLNDSGPGSLRQALIDESGTILFDAALDGGTIRLFSGQLNAVNQLISAESLPRGIILDAGGTQRILNITGGADANNLSFINGNAGSGDGGAVLIAGSGANVFRQCRFRNNRAENGGAIFRADADAGNFIILEACSFEENFASRNGGAASIGGAGSLTIDRSGFYHNTAGSNSATSSSGGALEIVGRTSGNISHSTFYGNVVRGSEGSGGAILNFNSTAPQRTRLTFCTVVNNSAPTIGGGIVTRDGGLRLASSVVAENTAASASDLSGDDVDSFGGNFIGDFSGSTGLFPSEVLTGDPMLSPLGNFGGPTLTVMPLVGSPLIGGVISPSPNKTRDQRSGVFRNEDPLFIRDDLGAVQTGPNFVVNTIQDESSANGTTSLREAVALAAATVPGGSISFDPAVFSGSLCFRSEIVLTQGEINIPPVQALAPDDPSDPAVSTFPSIFIDGSGITAPPVLKATSGERIFNIPASTVLSGHRLVLADGSNSSGGAVRIAASGFFSLSDSTLRDNFSSNGGAIRNDNGGFLFTRCTFVRNQATTRGGAIYNNSSLLIPRDVGTLRLCTFSDNSAIEGGAVHNNDGRLEVIQSTLAGNRSPVGALTSYGDSFTETRLRQSIVAGNFGSDLNVVTGASNNSIASDGLNVIGLRGDGGTLNPLAGLASGGDITSVSDPRLAALADYGGPVFTRPLLYGSPAIDRPGSLTTLPPAGDARGGPAVGLIDSGAVQAPASALVTTNANSGAGSLREAIDGAAPTGVLIGFEPAVFDGEAADAIALSSTLQPDAARFILIDATSAENVTLIPGPRNGISHLGSTAGTFSLHGLTIDGQGVSGSGGLFTGARAVADRSIFENLRGTGRSGISSLASAITHVVDSRFSGNVADGGAINHSGLLRIERSTFTENQGFNSAGALWIDGCLLARNATFTRNRAGDEGPAIRFGSGATALLDQITVTENTGSVAAGGITIDDGALVHLKNSILAGNASNSVDPGQDSNLEGVFASTSGSLIGVGLPGLLPLGDYGGLTPTMPPSVASPAIDLGVGQSLGSDQRGFNRLVGSALDAGAVEAQPSILVTSAADSGSGTLREALSGSLAPGTRVRFDPTLFTGNAPSIVLSSPIDLTDAEYLLIDATDLPMNPVINAGGSQVNQRRAFIVSSSSQVTLSGLDLTGGTGEGNGGGFAENGGLLRLVDCYVFGNRSNQGGAIINFDRLELFRTTFSDNFAAGVGGAVLSFTNDSVFARQSTFTGNNSVGSGAALAHNPGARLVLEECTFVDNVSSGGSIGGVLLFNTPEAFIVNDTIIAGNSGSQTNQTPTGFRNFLSGAPELVPLAYYGGRIPTRPPEPDSPVVDQSELRQFTASFADARGASRNISTFNPIFNGNADIGAAEYQVRRVSSRNDSGSNTLRAALEAPFGSTVTFSPTTGGSFPLDSQILVTQSRLVDASTLAAGVTLDGQDSTRLIQVASPATLVLTAVDLTNGRAPGDGGAIYNSGTLNLVACSLRNNTARSGEPEGQFLPGDGFPGGDGGAIFNASGATLTIKRSEIINNAAGNGSSGFGAGTSGGPGGSGGAVLAQADSQVTITESLLSGNVAGLGGLGGDNGNGTFGPDGISGYGGAVYSDRANVQILRSTLSNNNGRSRGGAIYAVGDPGFSTLVTASTLTENQAFEGAAFFGAEGYNAILSSTIAGNTSFSGTAVFSSFSAIIGVANSIIAGNSATGGDVGYSQGIESSGEFTSSGHNMIGSGSATFYFGGNGDQFETEPRLAPLGEYGGPTPTMPPMRNSPAIDQGGSLFGGADLQGQRGLSRPEGFAPEVGAVEVQTVAVAFLTDNDGNGIPDQLEGVNGIFPQSVFDPSNPADSDGDGITDAREIETGTNPFDPSSRLKITRFAITGTQVEIEHTAFPGLSYEIQRSTDLNFPSEPILGNILRAEISAPTRNLPINSHTDREFFRVRAVD